MAKYKEALVVYEHAIHLESSNAQFHVNKGSVLFKMAKSRKRLLLMNALLSWNLQTLSFREIERSGSEP